MSKILAVLLCCIAVEAHAIVVTPNQPPPQPPPETPQIVKPETTSKPSPSHSNTRKPPEKKQANRPAEKRASLPPPSKASLGFYQAAVNANYDMMDIYLKQGADINCLNCNRDHQATALFSALVANGNWNFQLADWLIQRGADINIPATVFALSGQIPGWTLVMSAAAYNNVPNLSALDYLVKHGADVKAVDLTGRNALHHIREWNWIDNKDIGNNTARDFIAFVDTLVAHGIDVNKQDKSGATALMNATNYCSPSAVKLLISYGANAALKDKLGKSALDIAIDRATASSQNSRCNEVVNILNNPQQVAKALPVQSEIVEKPTPTDSGSVQQGAASYAGTYGGTYNGSDEGTFQTTVLPNGTATLSGHSNKIGVSFTGKGKVNSDGSVAIGSASTGSTFTGSISRDGGLTGTWKNTSYNQAGSFQGAKGVQVANTPPPPTNPLEAIGGLLNGLNKILAPH